MVVIPKRAQRLVNVSSAWVSGKNARQHIGVVLVIELADLEEVAGDAVAFRWRVAVVQVRGCGGQPKSIIVALRQIIEISYQNRLDVLRGIGRSRNQTIKAPQGLPGKIGRHR